MSEEFIPYLGADVLFVAPTGQLVPAKITAFQQAQTPQGQQVEIAVLTLFLANGLQCGVGSPHDQLGKTPNTFHFAGKPTRLVGANGNRIAT